MPTVSLDRTPLVKLTFRGYVGRMGIFSARKIPKMLVSIFRFDAGMPLFGNLTPRDAKESRLIVFPWAALILRVYGLTCLAQLRKSIVALNSKPVVNVTGRPFPGHVEPSESVGKVQVVIYANEDIAVSIKPPSGIPNVDPAALNSPIKNPRLGIIVKKFTQTLRGKIGLSHDALLMLIGQRPARVDSTGGLRHFNVGGV